MFWMFFSSGIGSGPSRMAFWTPRSILQSAKIPSTSWLGGGRRRGEGYICIYKNTYWAKSPWLAQAPLGSPGDLKNQYRGPK